MQALILTSFHHVLHPYTTLFSTSSVLSQQKKMCSLYRKTSKTDPLEQLKRSRWWAQDSQSMARGIRERWNPDPYQWEITLSAAKEGKTVSAIAEAIGNRLIFPSPWCAKNLKPGIYWNLQKISTLSLIMRSLNQVLTH